MSASTPTIVSEYFGDGRLLGAAASLTAENASVVRQQRQAVAREQEHVLRERAQVDLSVNELTEPEAIASGRYHIALETPPPLAGKRVLVDIEVSKVGPEGRLAGRYARNL